MEPYNLVYDSGENDQHTPEYRLVVYQLVVCDTVCMLAMVGCEDVKAADNRTGVFEATTVKHGFLLYLLRLLYGSHLVMSGCCYFLLGAEYPALVEKFLEQLDGLL